MGSGEHIIEIFLNPQGSGPRNVLELDGWRLMFSPRLLLQISRFIEKPPFEAERRNEAQLVSQKD